MNILTVDAHIPFKENLPPLNRFEHNRKLLVQNVKIIGMITPINHFIQLRFLIENAVGSIYRIGRSPTRHTMVIHRIHLVSRRIVVLSGELHVIVQLHPGERIGINLTVQGIALQSFIAEILVTTQILVISRNIITNRLRPSIDAHVMLL